MLQSSIQFCWDWGPKKYCIHSHYWSSMDQYQHLLLESESDRKTRPDVYSSTLSLSFSQLVFKQFSVTQFQSLKILITYFESVTDIHWALFRGLHLDPQSVSFSQVVSFSQFQSVRWTLLVLDSYIQSATVIQSVSNICLELDF